MAANNSGIQTASGPLGLSPWVSTGAIVGMILIGYATLCYATSLFLDLPTRTLLTTSIPPGKDIILGPVKIDRAQSVYTIDVTGPPLANNEWLHVNGELLDHRQETLLGFGDEFWHEEGYDEGHWSESKTSYQMRVTFPQPGQYYLKLDTESSGEKPEASPEEIRQLNFNNPYAHRYSRTPTGSHISIQVKGRSASPLPHQVLAWFSIILGLLVLVGAGLVYYNDLPPETKARLAETFRGDDDD
ncbi:MAG: hypothetical protein SFZ03_09925 [Candidatus Melainabacteria bacterium]|nr:hypothetical protein [Candidatus Melainabacteria bacterium]